MLYISLCSATDAAHGERDVAHAKQETSICEVRKLKLHIHISSRAEHTLIILCCDSYPGWVSPRLFVSVSY